MNRMQSVTEEARVAYKCRMEFLTYGAVLFLVLFFETTPRYY